MRFKSRIQTILLYNNKQLLNFKIIITLNNMLNFESIFILKYLNMLNQNGRN